jgi:hypothetical protein
MLVNRQGREKPHDLFLAHLHGMTLVMEQDKPPDPAHIRLLRPPTIVSYPDRLPDLVKQPGPSPGRGASHPGNALVDQV